METISAKSTVSIHDRSIKGTKTDETRTVDLSINTVKLLTSHIWLNESIIRESSYLFTSSTGTLLDHNNVVKLGTQERHTERKSNHAATVTYSTGGCATACGADSTTVTNGAKRTERAVNSRRLDLNKGVGVRSHRLLAAGVNCTLMADENCTLGHP